MTAKLMTDYNLEFLSLLGGCTGLSESTLVEMPHCGKSHVAIETTVPDDWVQLCLICDAYLYLMDIKR